MTILSAQGLSKRYGPVRALVDVTLRVEEGVTGLLGPNGAGKSTLLLCALGLLRGWTGDVRVLGHDARRDGRALRRRVGFMPEGEAWLPDMSGVRAATHLGRLSGLPRAEALRRGHEVLWHVGLGEAIYREVREYSVGMRQRFKLAQALVHDPELIVLDEPLGGLDPAGRDELLELVRDLSRQHGKHVIWSSHILPEVQKVADQVVVLDGGRLQGWLRLDELAAGDGRHEVEVEGDGRALAAELERLGARVERASPAVADVTGGRQRLTVSLREGGTAGDVLRAAHASGARVRRVTPRRESLEEAFQRLLASRPEAPAAAGVPACAPEDRP